MKRRQPQNLNADIFIPDYPIVHDDSRIAGGVKQQDSSIARGKAEKFCSSGVFPKNFSTYYNVRLPISIQHGNKSMTKTDSIRDKFAGQALMALINRPSEYAEPIDAMERDGPHSTFLQATDVCLLNYAKVAYRFADAMLIARSPVPSDEP